MIGSQRMGKGGGTDNMLHVFAVHYTSDTVEGMLV